MQHRYYGKSIPYGGHKEVAYSNATTLGYLSSTQALADYAALITDLKKNLSAVDSPVIVFGGSYGGSIVFYSFDFFIVFANLDVFVYCGYYYFFYYMVLIIKWLGAVLAAWFRLKYPHVAIGALASSAPILYFDDLTSPYSFSDIITKDFKVIIILLLF